MADLTSPHLRLPPVDGRPTPAIAAEPLLLSAKDLARTLGLGLRTIRSMDAAGKLPAPVRIGGAVRWRAAEIRDWLDAGAPDRKTWERIRDHRK